MHVNSKQKINMAHSAKETGKTERKKWVGVGGDMEVGRRRVGQKLKKEGGRSGNIGGIFIK